VKRVRDGLIGLALAVGAAAPPAAQAHHSFAMFDRDKQLALTGVVTDFQWTNPHSWIEIDVPNAAGASDKWGVELNSPNNLARQGWRSTALKPGDKVTVVLNPLRSGEHGGLFLQVTLPDGKVLGDRFLKNPAAPNGATPSAPGAPAAAAH
jgi:hypothetical protein